MPMVTREQVEQAIRENGALNHLSWYLKGGHPSPNSLQPSDLPTEMQHLGEQRLRTILHETSGHDNRCALIVMNTGAILITASNFFTMLRKVREYPPAKNPAQLL